MILITGVSGLLGANLLFAAEGHGYEVTGVYRQHAMHFPAAETVRADLTRPGAASDLLRSRKPEWVIHCAAATDVDWCEDHPKDALKTNVDATRRLAVAARSIGARFVYISTDAVFDGKGGPYGEGDPSRPVNVYGETKAEGERATRAELPQCLIVRTNIYGWSVQETKPSLAEWVLGQLETGSRVPGFQDVTFTPILVNDFGDILLELLDRGLEGIYHVAGSEALTKYRFAQRVAARFGYPEDAVLPATLGGSKLRAPRPRSTPLRTDLVRKVLGRDLPDVSMGLMRFKQLRDEGYLDKLKACRGG